MKKLKYSQSVKKYVCKSTIVHTSQQFHFSNYVLHYSFHFETLPSNLKVTRAASKAFLHYSMTLTMESRKKKIFQVLKSWKMKVESRISKAKCNLSKEIIWTFVIHKSCLLNIVILLVYLLHYRCRLEFQV